MCCVGGWVTLERKKKKNHYKNIFDFFAAEKKKQRKKKKKKKRREKQKKKKKKGKEKKKMAPKTTPKPDHKQQSISAFFGKKPVAETPQMTSPPAILPVTPAAVEGKARREVVFDEAPAAKRRRDDDDGGDEQGAIDAEKAAKAATKPEQGAAEPAGRMEVDSDSDDRPILGRQQAAAPQARRATISTASMASFAYQRAGSVGETPVARHVLPRQPVSPAGRDDAEDDGQQQGGEKRRGWLAAPRDLSGRLHSEPGADLRTLFIPPGEFSKLSAFEQQFWAIKRHHFDVVIFFQKGKFYEMFEGDAEIGHRYLDLKLTDRVNMKMVGVPEGHFATWAAKLIALGFKVGKVDQAESSLQMMDRGKGKGKGGAGEGIIRRELRGILTCGTLVDEGMLATPEAKYLMCVKQDQATGQVGVCYVDAATGVFHVGEFEDDERLSKLETVLMQVQPAELVVEKSGLSPRATQLLRAVCGPDVPTTQLRSGDEFPATADAALAVIRPYFGAQAQGTDLPAFVASAGPALLLALGATVTYLKVLMADKAVVSGARFRRHDTLEAEAAAAAAAGTTGTTTTTTTATTANIPSDDEKPHLLLDGHTLANLDILDAGVGGLERVAGAGSLLHYLDHCSTGFGKRLLRLWVCHPLRGAAAIAERGVAVDELFGDSTGLLDELTGSLAKLPDLERAVSRIRAGTSKLEDAIKTLQGFESLAALFARCLPRVRSPLLATLLGSDFPAGISREVSELSSTFNIAKARREGVFEPTPGAAPQCDEAAAALARVERALGEELAKARAHFGDDAVEFKHMGKEPFQLCVPIRSAERRPPPAGWSTLKQTKAAKHFWTPRIKELVPDQVRAQENLATAKAGVYQAFLARLASSQAMWLEAVRCAATVDCLCSLARAALNTAGAPTCRPVMLAAAEQPGPVLELRGMRHPCVPDLASFIPNDTVMGCDAEPATSLLITGPNMGGKSTLLRQTCLAVVLAQLGARVPAEAMRLTPVDRIFTRLGANDRIMAGQSTFMVELQETATILRDATSSSLVILDELGRGTSTYDGYSIAHAVLARLAGQTRCRTLFSTHYHMLTTDPALLALGTVQNYRMNAIVDAQARRDDVTFLYKFVKGVCSKSYGMNVARLAGLDEKVVEEAERVSGEFEQELDRQRAKASLIRQLCRVVTSA
jgi:DNA mismatch repair protein MSH6